MNQGSKTDSLSFSRSFFGDTPSHGSCELSGTGVVGGRNISRKLSERRAEIWHKRAERIHAGLLCPSHGIVVFRFF